MKIAETKIYLKFIVWFVLVSVLPLFLLFALIFQFDLQRTASIFASAGADVVIFGFLVTLALILILAMVAAKLMAKSINNPVQISVNNLIKVVNSLSKSISNLAEISKNNRQAIKTLTVSTNSQLQNLKSNHKLITKIAGLLSETTDRVNLASKSTANIDALADEGETKAKVGLNSLVAIKLLSTENQKLNQALNDYAQQVAVIAGRVSSLADLAKYLSVNATIEANKSNISEEFSALVSQIRELNVISQQAADSISQLTQDMQRQFEQTKQSSRHELKETDKSINVIDQAIQLLTNITKQSRQISKNIKIISAETNETNQSAQAISQAIVDLNKEAQGIVKSTDSINQMVVKQNNISQSLNRAFNTLRQVVTELDKIVGKIF